MSLYSKLYDWQKQIVDKYHNRRSLGLFLDMGLGKTLLSLAFAEINNCSKVFIVTLNSKALEDKSISGSWLNWSSQSNIKYEFKNKYSTDFDDNTPELLILNYEALFERGSRKTQRITIKQNIEQFIQSCKGHNVAIILDESHKVKNLQSQQTQAIIKIQKDLQKITKNVYTYLLTGTPFTTGYIDLYTQLKILGCSMTKQQFVDNFCVRGNIPGLLGWQQPIVSYKNVKYLFTLIHQYAITIKSDDVIQLPDKIFINHLSKLSSEFTAFTSEKLKVKDIINIYKQHNIIPDDTLLNAKNKYINNPFFRNIDYPDMTWLAETSGTNWLRARELSIGFQGNANNCKWYDKTRLKQVEAFLENERDNYILFYNYTPELLELYEICEKLGYNVDVYCGEIKSLINYDKYSSLDDNQKLTSKNNIILANYASGATGLNWQNYNKCILFSIPLYKDYEQALKRIHRIGQKQTVFYHIFYQDNWLDRDMLKALQQGITYSNDMYNATLEKFNKEAINDN